MLAAFLLGAAAAVCVTLAVHALSSSSSHSRYVTLPTAYDIRQGRWHSVDPLDCHPADVAYSGRAVCSWVRNP